MNEQEMLQRMSHALFLEDVIRRHKLSWRVRTKLLRQGRIVDQNFENIVESLNQQTNHELQIHTECFQDEQMKAESLYEEGLRLTVSGCPTWPVLLDIIDDPPLWLWYKGKNPSIFDQHVSVAVVGARKASNYSSHLCKRIVRDLVKREHPIVSGLAHGIDGDAHRECLKAGGQSAAILPCGLSECYPKSHRILANDLQKDGFIASEFPPFYPIRKSNFHCRNRLISGISHAVIIIQAAAKSGSIMTGRTAGEQGRDVYVAPSTLDDPTYQGSLELIADGALLLSSLQVLDHIKGLNSYPSQSLHQGTISKRISGQNSKSKRSSSVQTIEHILDEQELFVIQTIGHRALSRERLFQLCKMPYSTFFSLFTKLEQKWHD